MFSVFLLAKSVFKKITLIFHMLWFPSNMTGFFVTSSIDLMNGGFIISLSIIAHINGTPPTPPVLICTPRSCHFFNSGFVVVVNLLAGYKTKAFLVFWSQIGLYKQII